MARCWILIALCVCIVEASEGLHERRYYTIANPDGHQLGVDPESYRLYLEKKNSTQTQHHRHVSVVLTLATDGDFEKWQIRFVSASTTVEPEIRIINKATGLALAAVRPDASTTRGYRYFASDNDDRPETQIFRLRRAADDDSYRIALAADADDELSVLSAKGSPAHRHPRVKVSGKRHLENGTGHIWTLRPAICDPHPDRVYRLVHVHSRKYMTIPSASINAQDQLVHAENRSSVASSSSLFKFVPTDFDKKILRIQNLATRKVLDIGRVKSYGSDLTQSDMDGFELSQHWYILPSKDRSACIFGNVDSYRYFGLKRDPESGQYAGVVVLKEHTATLDEYWALEEGGSD